MRSVKKVALLISRNSELRLETDALRTDFKTEVDTPNESTRVASIRPKIRWCYFVLNTHLFFFSVRMSFFVVVKTNS